MITSSVATFYVSIQIDRIWSTFPLNLKDQIKHKASGHIQYPTITPIWYFNAENSSLKQKSRPILIKYIHRPEKNRSIFKKWSFNPSGGSYSLKLRETPTDPEVDLLRAVERFTQAWPNSWRPQEDDRDTPKGSMY